MKVLDEIRPQDFLNALADGIVVLDADLRILYQNAQHQSVFGNHVGRTCHDAYECRQVVCDHCPLERSLKDGGRHVSTRRINCMQGERCFEIVASPLRNSMGRIVAGVELVRDITARVRAEEECARLLKCEKEARAEAEEAMRKHDTFVAIASHELKTPFSALQFQLQGLARMARGQSKVAFSDEGFARQIEIAEQQAERMARLIENLLSVSRIASGDHKLNLEDYDLRNLVHESAARLESPLARAGCTLRVDAPEPVICHCDRLRIEEILVNLLTNAIRHGARAPIELIIRGDDVHATMSVSDRGKGIHPEDRKRIFCKFERGQHHDKQGGLGLGLYIAREIATEHGGTIAVEAVLPHGATFIVTLPRHVNPKS